MKTYSVAIETILSKSVILSPKLLDEVVDMTELTLKIALENAGGLNYECFYSVDRYFI